MTKKEQLESIKREHAYDRQETRDNEWFIRDGEDQRIQVIRDKMTRILHDAEIEPIKRKEILASLKDEIDDILDKRDDREHAFIEEELKRHQVEEELKQEIEKEEEKEKQELAKSNGEAQLQTNSLNILFRARSSLNAGAEQLRKNIEENRKELSEEEQFSTILINNSERDTIPNFKKSRRKKAEPKEPAVRIDSIVLKQREIGLMYRESQELQNQQLNKKPTKPQEPEPDPLDEPFSDNEEDYIFEEE
ncbi:MAG: hypothetical protein FWC89_07585 [Defluviitaleaceae bacterium]|nr:hypothetical protein [Defluviitaleaceae bacterium]